MVYVFTYTSSLRLCHTIHIQAREKHDNLNSRLSQLRSQTAEEEAQIQTLERDIEDIEGQV